MNPMKRYLLPGVALLLGIAIGHLSGSDSHENKEQNVRSERAGRTRSAERSLRESAGPATEFQRLRNEIHPATPEQITALVYQVLEIADPNERKIALCEAIRAASPDQCQAIMDQFVRISRETGRIQNDV